MAKQRKVRVLLTKSALDAHDRALRVIGRALRDGGAEVVFIRHYQPEEIVTTAQQEDVDVIGLSSSDLGYKYDIPQVMKLLREKNMAEVKVILGGIISGKDVSLMMEAGVSRVFGAGSSLQEIVEYISQLAAEKQASPV